jgi:glycosyltransferase involved in cell wall biosynthesis
MNMRVVFVSPSFYPAFHYGGPTFINRSFCRAMAEHENLELEVLTTDANGPGQRIDSQAQKQQREGYDITYCRRWFSPDIAPGLCLRLWGKIRNADVVHLNGVYSFTTIPTLAFCKLLKKPLVWSTMGGLQRWEGTTRVRAKRVWERICNWLSSPELVLMHVTSEQERTESVGKVPNASAFLLRNGIDVPTLLDHRNEDSKDVLRLLYIGRLHPIKGIENLLTALTMVKSRVNLAICGEGDLDYESHLRALVARLGLTEIVRFQGQVDGEIKESHFREANLCIAPSFKEASCTVVLESLARAVPVIVTTGTPWQRVEERGCGLCVDNGSTELANAIDRAAGLALTEMGLRGRAWMQEEFSWSQIADEMIETYKVLTTHQTREPQPFTKPEAA